MKAKNNTVDTDRETPNALGIDEIVALRLIRNAKAKAKADTKKREINIKRLAGKRMKIGDVAVDSGQLMICDPCYADSQWKKNEEYHYREVKANTHNEFSYQGASDATSNDEFRAGEMVFKRGHVGAGVAFRSGYGDGFYPVFATYNDEGRIVKVEIEMG